MYAHVCKSSNGVLFKSDWKYHCVFNWDGEDPEDGGFGPGDLEKLFSEPDIEDDTG